MSIKLYKKSKAFLAKKSSVFIATKMLFWFSLGAFLGLFFLASFMFIFYQRSYENAVYPGVVVNGIDMGGKTQEQVNEFFSNKNTNISDTPITFTSEDLQASSSAKELGIGYDASLMSEQAYSVGRTGNFFSDVYLLFDAYLHGVPLNPAYTLDEKKLEEVLQPIMIAVTREPQNALFSFENGKVTSFKTAINGQKADTEKLKELLLANTINIIATANPQPITIAVPLTIKEPDITNEEANDLGISELVAKGSSLFYGSIENRIYNLTPASIPGPKSSS